MYRLIIESLLGLRLEVDHLRFDPRLPSTWKSFRIHYRYRETFYHVTIENPTGNAGTAVKRVVVDGQEQPDLRIPLVDNRQDHQATVYLG
jgi:cellobiose phosphorylase